MVTAQVFFKMKKVHKDLTYEKCGGVVYGFEDIDFTNYVPQQQTQPQQYPTYYQTQYMY